MKITKTQLDAEIRENFLEKISEFFRKSDEDVQRTKSNQIAFPTLDRMDNEKWVVITVTVPKGSRDGDEYDGYSVAEEYQMKLIKAEQKKLKKEEEKKKRNKGK